MDDINLNQNASAREIIEYFLHKTGAAIKNNDFDAFRACVALPHMIDTVSGERIIETDAELRETFDGVVHSQLVKGVTEMDRRCVSALFRSDDVVIGTHETRLLNDGVLISEPYPVLAVFTKIEGKWAMTHSSYGMIDDQTLLRALNGASQPD